MLCALIMAGGKGERFWPLSTEEKPKQFLKLLGEDTMLQMTVKRLLKLIPIERIFIVTAERYIGLVKEQLPGLDEKNIIMEPIGRNTAPCIALSAFVIDKYYNNATIAVLPSDHLIQDENKFIDILASASNFVEAEDDAIVTLGMKPTRPETGYGYIKFAETYKEINGFHVKRVENFVEKPNIEKALKYLKEGSYLWNGGMFVWKTSTILNLTEQHLNNTYKILNEIAVAEDDEFDSILSDKYCSVDNVSIDYGIMEKANNIFVIPSELGWDDVGTWHSVERVRKKDTNENIYSGTVKTISSHNNIVMANDKTIVMAGVDDLFVVESDDLIFIGSKEVIKDIKDIKNKLS